MTTTLSARGSLRPLAAPSVGVVADTDGESVSITAEPTYASPVTNYDLTAARLGAEMLGLPLLEQGERVAALLESRTDEGDALYPECVVEIGRRAAKTTSIWSTIIGRAMTRPGYRCVTTAQSGKIASRVLMEHANLLVANGHSVYSDQARSGSGTHAVVYRNGGREEIRFPNGSLIWMVPPDAGAVRSAASDDVLVDEGGEFEGEKGADFLAGVRPLMDTKGPLAQLIVAGTPGRERLGMFWDLLTAGRLGTEPDLGILDYCLRDDEDPEDRAIWQRVHPGPASGLTSMRVLERRYRSLGAITFAREYLCAWPSDAATGALDVEAWRGQGTDEFPEARPRRSVIGVSSVKEATVTGVVEVWRNEAGKACIEVLAYRPGTAWAARFAHGVARRTKAPVVIDENVGGANAAIAADLRRLKPPVKIETPTRLIHIGAAAQLLATEIHDGRVEHYNQPDLTQAVEACAWRPLGREGRAFMRRAGAQWGEIALAVAASQALWQYDQTPVRRAGGGVVSASV